MAYGFSSKDLIFLFSIELGRKSLLAGMRNWYELESVFSEAESKYKGFYARIDVNPAPKKRRNLIRYLSELWCFCRNGRKSVR